jgi:predicted RND superfamily exporter protein
MTNSHAGETGMPAGWHTIGWMIVVALTLLAGYGLSRLRIDDDLRALVRNGSADFRTTDEVSALFGAPDHDCIIRATARSGDIFDAAALAQLRDAVGRLREIAGVEDVRSIFDVRRQGPAGALLPVIPRTRDELDAEARAAAKARAARHPLVAGHLLSADAGSSLLLVRLAAAADRPPLLPEVIAAIERTLDATRGPSSALDMELTGLPALREQAARSLRRDMLIFNSLGLSLAVVLSAVVARSLRSTVVACVPPFVGAVWAMGVLGLCGTPVNILTSVVPSLALVVGTCDSIHFIEDMRRSVRRGLAPLAASSGAISRVGWACGLTSLVTAIGFASLAAAQIDAVRSFGIAAAVGALASFLAVSLLTPLIAATGFCSGARLGRSSRAAGRLANRLAAVSLRHARPIALAGAGLTLLLAFAGGGIDADNRVVDSLPRDAAASRALRSVDDDFGGAMGVDVVVGWPDDVDWRDGVVLASLADVHGVLDRSGGISRAISLSTVATPLPDRARNRLDAEDFRDLVAPESRVALVRARVPDLGSRTLEGVYDRVDAELEELQRRHPGWRFELTGMSVVSARNIRQLVRDLGSSLLLEVTVIGVILALAFRSPLAGLVSMVPNVFPLTVIACLLVATGRSLDPATVIVFNVCLGLAVDDTVHLLSALARQRKAGIPIGAAVRRAVAETGNAVVIGGVVLTVGFATVTASSVPTLAGFGMLACAAVAAATVAELVFLPALLVATDGAVRRRFPMFSDGVFGPRPATCLTGATEPSTAGEA